MTRRLSFVAIVIVWAARSAFAQTPVDGAVTYQGRLKDEGQPATGPYNMQFRLYAADIGGAPLATYPPDGPMTVTVQDGLFTAILDFGMEAFNGERRWLEVVVEGVTLAPRQELTATPYALYALNGPGGDSLWQAGTGGAIYYDGGDVGVGISTPNARLNAYTFGTTALMGQSGSGLGVYGVSSTNAGVMGYNSTSGTFGKLGDPSYAVYGEKPDGIAGYFAGDVHITGDLTLDGSFNTNAWSLTGNAGTVPGTNFLGTTDNQPLTLKVNGTRAFRLEPALWPNVVGGQEANEVALGAKAATIAGGGGPAPNNNRVTADGGTVGGGIGNRAGNNGTPTDGDYATVAGGQGNVASGNDATVSGGLSNHAGGDWSAVPGGWGNAAGGNYSFAGGLKAQVRDATQVGGGDPDGDEGSFVWADASDPDNYFTSTGPDQFLVRATGGVGINTNAPGSPLTVNGVVESLTGGFKFPDDTVQTTAGWSLKGNAGTDPNVNFLGTTDNQPLTLKVNDGRAMRMEEVTVNLGAPPPFPDHYSRGVNVLAGSPYNTIAPGATSATISGGGAWDWDEGYPGYAVPNSVTATAFLGGTIGGGTGNEVSGAYATIGGGHSNNASGAASTIAGGFENVAVGDYSAVPGGYLNKAGARYSFAAGYRAKVRSPADFFPPGIDPDGDPGTFVWADSTDANFMSTGPDQFLVRATGGVGINTNNPTSPLTVAGVVQSTTGGFRFPDGVTISSGAAVGDITGVTAGSGLTGGGTSGSVTLSANFAGNGSAATISRSDHYHNALNASDGSPTNVVYADPTGNVGIGTASPRTPLDVLGSVSVERALDDLGGITWYEAGTDQWIFPFFRGWQSDNLIVRDEAGLLDTMTFEAGTGCVGIGVGTDPTEKLDVIGTARLRGIGTSTGTTVVADANGKLWKQSSSLRYKHNIADLPDVGDAVLDLRPVRFDWDSTGEPDIGLIAEEVECVLPDLVIRDADGQPDGVRYDKVALYLTGVVKEQREQISVQRAQIKAQQDELSNLRARLEKIEARFAGPGAQASGGVR